MTKIALRFLVLFLLMCSAVQAQDLNRLMQKINVNTKGSIAYSKDKAFFVVSQDDKINLYATEGFRLSRTLEGHSKDITSLSFSSDGIHLMSTGADRRVILWDYMKGTQTSAYSLGEPIIGGQILDGLNVALITDDNLVVASLETKSVRFQKKEHTKPIRSLAVSADGNRIYTGAGDGKVIEYSSVDGSMTNAINASNTYVRALDVSTDDKYIAIGDDNGVVKIVDRQGQTKQQFSDAKGWVRSVKFSMDTKYVSAGDDYGNIFIYSLEKGVLTEKISEGSVPIVSVAFSPDGKEFAFVQSQKDVRIFNVSRLNIASVFRFRDQKDMTAPQIFVSSPPNIQDEGVRVYKDLIEIRGTLMDESGIRGLKINGKDVPIKENNNFVMFYPLSMGENPVAIEARDVNDNVAVRRFTITRRNQDGEEYDVTKARNFLFVVGINDYMHWPKLNNAVRDAGDITNILLQTYNFDFGNLTMLKNEQATRSNVYNALRALIEQVTPQDNLLIYFSGHGYFDPILNEGYWIPVEAKVNSVGDYLSNSDLLKVIGNINAQHTFLIADACFSGSLFGETKRGYADNVEKFRSRWGLASGRLEVVSDGEVGKNSPFATAILNYLKDNTKEKVAISELVQAVKIKVAETSQQTPLGNPLKVSGDEGGELVLYRKK